MNEKTMTLTRMEAPAQLPVRKRVAAYARVSMEKDAMLHSLAAQVSYYSERIQRNPKWEYAGVFADFGLTGTKETRPEFQRMLKECREGKIDLILVKSISRFARNTLALLNTVRELKGLGIGVYFEEQKLDTLSGDGEFMLTILASFAQEESRSVSENCKWRIRKKFEQGIPTGFGMYGYEVRNGSFAIKPEEAAVVRRIFQMYLDGMGSVKIMKLLTEEGVPAPLGGLWNASVVMEILKNEKYVGDLLLQKFYTNNHVEKKRFHNRGELPQYFVGEDHEPIIDRETFDAVQREIAWRTARRKAAKLVYDVAHSVPVKGRAAELARGHVAERDAALTGSEVHRAYIGALALFEHRAFRHRAGRDYAYDIPLHKSLCQRRVFRLLAYRDLVALGDEPRDVGLRAVVRHSAHRRALVGVFNGTVARRQREVKLARGDLRVVVEHLIKVAETEEQQAVLMLLFYFVVLLFHGCKLSHDSFSLSLNGG